MFGEKRAPWLAFKGSDGWWRLVYRRHDSSVTVAIAPTFLDAELHFPDRAKKFIDQNDLKPYHPNPSIRRSAARLLRRTGEDLDEL